MTAGETYRAMVASFLRALIEHAEGHGDTVGVHRLHDALDHFDPAPLERHRRGRPVPAKGGGD